jgi:tRNA A64-2'-O-ribosylphosphate transferase
VNLHPHSPHRTHERPYQDSSDIKIDNVLIVDTFPTTAGISRPPQQFYSLNIPFLDYLILLKPPAEYTIMAQPLSQSDIIFPHLSNTPKFSSTLSSLRRSALSITNRLDSITKDSEFVSSVAESYGLPLVANERCGSWYIPLDLKASSVYFKSTDGHMGEWAFSLRRLNLQLLDVVSQYGGCVIVDSTRRGKSMPDALSKTVPFWCCVINRAVFGGERKGDEAMDLFTPPTAVSESEHTLMERRVDGFVQQFLV